MQSFKVVTAPNQNVKIQIEGVGTVAQIVVAEKLFKAGVIDWKCRCNSANIALVDTLIDMAINTLGLYPRQF